MAYHFEHHLQRAARKLPEARGLSVEAINSLCRELCRRHRTSIVMLYLAMLFPVLPMTIAVWGGCIVAARALMLGMGVDPKQADMLAPLLAWLPGGLFVFLVYHFVFRWFARRLNPELRRELAMAATTGPSELASNEPSRER